MKKIYLAVSVCIISGFTQVQAADNSFYIGASYGATNTSDSGITNLTGSASLDESDHGFKISAGYRLNDYASIEGHYADLGEISLTGVSGDTYTIDGSIVTIPTGNNLAITTEQKSIGLSAIVSTPISEMISPFARIGVHYWKTDVTLSIPSVSFSDSDDDIDLFYGVGIDVSITDNFSIRAEYERYDFGGADFDFASAGAVYNF